mmetsp:Transcript_1656/g.2927  ORF Transcript_1656/g.2927 Transcript_1656/m.2927 type:complete len:301 (+) Transcript_1656:93-995(+)
MHHSEYSATSRQEPQENFLSTAPSSVAVNASSNLVQGSSNIQKSKTTNQEGKSGKKSGSAKLENYKMIRELGEGAFGLVRLAVDKKSGQMVAVKTVNMQKTVQMNKDKHVVREKCLLDSLRDKHFSIINLLSTFRDQTNLYFVFEHAPNGTLDELIRTCKGQLGEGIVKVYFAQLVNFIEFIQQQGIMHRDLKPQNIMLDENYNLKIIDFGDARKVEEQLDEPEDEEGGDEQLNGMSGRRDTFVGTINYQSPEVINGEDQGFPVDTWALGNILFKMLTGTVPFKGSNPISVHKDIKQRNI